MENSQLPKEIKERFLELPEPVQKIIMESDWEKKVRDIVVKYNLRIDQGSLLETETMLIMFGFISPEDFKSDLISDAGISEEVADQIEKEINDKIFRFIKDEIIVVTSENEDENQAVDTISDRIDEGKEEEKKEEQKAETIVEKTLVSEPRGMNSIIEEKLNKDEVEKPKKIDPYLEPIE